MSWIFYNGMPIKSSNSGTPTEAKTADSEIITADSEIIYADEGPEEE